MIWWSVRGKSIQIVLFQNASLACLLRYCEKRFNGNFRETGGCEFDHDGDAAHDEDMAIFDEVAKRLLSCVY